MKRLWQLLPPIFQRASISRLHRSRCEIVERNPHQIRPTSLVKRQKTLQGYLPGTAIGKRLNQAQGVLEVVCVVFQRDGAPEIDRDSPTLGFPASFM